MIVRAQSPTCSSRDLAPLSPELLTRMNAWWRVANYLSVGQVYLLANPLLREPSRMELVKPRLLGPWGTVPGLNFLYLHLNRIIKDSDLNLLFIAGPGTVRLAWWRAPGWRAPTARSTPTSPATASACSICFGNSPSPAASEPRRTGHAGLDHEGGELGHSLSHAYGAVLDNPALVAA